MKTKFTLVMAVLAITFSFAQDKKWTLKECVNHALENNLSVQQAKYTTDLRKEDVATAKGDFLPGVAASASQNFSFGSGFDARTNRRVSADRRSNGFWAEYFYDGI